MSLYNAQLSAGSLMIPESRRIAVLLLQKTDLAAWNHAIKVDNILQKSSPETAVRQARLIRQRLGGLEEEGVRLVACDGLEVCTQMLLLASIRQSRLLGDFLIDVYGGQLRRLETTLNIKDWPVFLYECEQRDPAVQNWTSNTRAKMLQVILRILTEAAYLEPGRSLRMTPPFLHPRVRAYLVNYKDHYSHIAMEQKK